MKILQYLEQKAHSFQILEQCCFKRGIYFQKIDSRKTSQICPNCGTETGKKDLSERVHVCGNCGYTTDRDVAAAQVVLNRGCAAVGQTVKMLDEGKFSRTPMSQESHGYQNSALARFDSRGSVKI